MSAARCSHPKSSVETKDGKNVLTASKIDMAK